MDSVTALFEKLKELTRGGPELLRAEIFGLRDWLTSVRAERPQGYMSRPKVRAAYMAYYLPLHLPEVFWILSQRDFVKDAFKKSKEIQVADFGAGPGTASLSFLLWARAQKFAPKFSFDLFDQSTAALESAAELIRAVDPNAQVNANRFDLRQVFSSEKTYDIALMSHVLNEWGNGPRYLEKKKMLVSGAYRALKDGGFLVIVEPPLREPTMDMMSLRDFIATEVSDLKVLQPCPRGIDFCPMKKARLGWCYAQPPREWSKHLGLTPWDKSLAWTLKKILDRPGFSYLVLQKTSKELNYPLHEISIADDRHRDGIRCNVKGIKKGKALFRGEYL